MTNYDELREDSLYHSCNQFQHSNGYLHKYKSQRIPGLIPGIR